MAFLDTTQQNPVPTTRGVLRGGPLVAGVEVSVMLSESHTLNANATRNALESGTQVSDHVIIDPYNLAIVFEVSNAGDGPMVARDVFDTFREMLEKRELMEVLTEHTIYDNMVLVGLTPLHAAPFKGRLQCTATLQRINQVKFQMVGRAANKVKNKSASGQVQAGTQNTIPVEDNGSLMQAGFSPKVNRD